jgi:LPXTG-motif cell wall-anchored protein
VLAALAKQVQPFASPEITAAFVGRRAAADPGSYTRLFDPSWRDVGSWPSGRWLHVRLRSASPSPWTDGKNVYLYSRKRRLLARDGFVYRVPRAVATQLRAARSLSVTGSSHVALATAGAVAVAALGFAGFVRRRRR